MFKGYSFEGKFGLSDFRPFLFGFDTGDNSFRIIRIRVNSLFESTISNEISLSKTGTFLTKRIRYFSRCKIYLV